MQNFIVRTQILENYGAHCEDGKFSSGNAYWKAKGGTDYLVTGLDRYQDAWAFVAAAFIENSLSYKEFPTVCITEEEWIAQLPDDAEYRDFLKEQVICVSPSTGKKFNRGYPQEI
jgi:hypothetical protein